ncbi:branched-chain amino acid ABC transporter substrate-binding protein [Micromonospora sp. WMMA1363]|uniref:branched-chain amino acid ABC transporter substrate-binding protein n=1 Tax=Micromonospora sp. WMMA1363 TaxID=3053985 RepID=UPI00259D04CC|nr:branched-chain amino acid ABC transporter substrate-binding protein [Micromonospora sp. WMMA1363]MDM4719908.1 branched-chain amino acid ABC transporter substrate-binding protein [Micromonospora sp. WMMA1363]
MRRSYSRVLGTAALAAVLVAAAGCQDSGGGDGGAASGDCGGKIAIFGAFSGDNAGLVLPSLNGAKLAIKQHNDANPDCKITMQEFDTQGDPAQATPVANQVAGDESFLGVIGGHFSGETDATMPVYEAAGLAMVSPSATRIDLTQKGNKSFFRVVGNDGTQAGAVSTYLKSQNAQRVFTIDDGSAYGAGIVAELGKNLGGALVGSDKIQEKQAQFDATISKIKAANADYVFHGGYTREAAPLVRQLRAAGVQAKFVGPDGLYDPAFPQGASGGADGAIITCPCLPADKAGGTFTADYQKEYGQAPGAYGAEGFDAAQVFADAFKDGKKSRAEILEYVKSYDKQGVSKYIKFADNGDVDPSKVVIWAYEIKGTTFEPLQELKLS